MKPMIWHPEPNDHKVNEYLDTVNHEPWLAIAGVAILLISLLTIVVCLN